jgi:hypothetical protein
MLVGAPLRDEHRGLVGLLGGLEETERAEDAAAALDQVVAGAIIASRSRSDTIAKP